MNFYHILVFDTGQRWKLEIKVTVAYLLTPTKLERFILKYGRECQL